MWAIVEIMGRRTRSGLVSDAQMGGATLLRIEHPTLCDPGNPEEPLIEYYAPQALFAVRPCTQEQAAACALWAWPVQIAQRELASPLDEYIDDDVDDVDDGFD